MSPSLSHIIRSCKNGDRAAQHKLFELYKGLLMGVARRYMKSDFEAEDVLVCSFVKIFKHLDSFQGKGSFEGWMKRIVVNEALMQLRKKTNFHLSIEDNTMQMGEDPTIIAELQYRDILDIVDTLPAGYRTVFNMYAIEGYKHREIAEELGISINTAKSQYLQAKKRLSALLKKKTTLRHRS